MSANAPLVKFAMLPSVVDVESEARKDDDFSSKDIEEDEWLVLLLVICFSHIPVLTLFSVPRGW
jgi:hypothetical protein